MKSIKYAIAALVLIAAVPALAGPATDSLAACLADSTTGKDRKDLARWIFAGMSAHPEMQDIANSTAATRERTSQAVGLLFTRLISESCSSQFRAARAESSQSIVVAFDALGKLAMQELMSNTEVRKAISGFEQFVDRKKVDAALAN